MKRELGMVRKLGEEGSVEPSQFYLTKKYERNSFHGGRRDKK